MFLLLSISILPSLPNTFCPRRRGAFWLRTTDARTLFKSNPPKFTFFKLMIVPTLISPLASIYLRLPTTSFAFK